MEKTGSASTNSPSEETASLSSPVTTTTVISKDLSPQYGKIVERFFLESGTCDTLPENYTSKDSYSHIIRDLLQADLIQRGRVSCVFSVLPLVTNFFGGLHGGFVAAIAERVSIACARTVVAEDKELFLGELGVSYLSAAPLNEVLTVDGSIVRSGRNLTVVAMEFRVKKTAKLVYTARATFFHMPASKL